MRDEWPQEYLQWFLIDHLCVYLFREFCDVTTVCRQEAPWVISPLYNDNESLVFISVGQFFEFVNLVTMQPYQGIINGLEVQTKYIQWEFTFSTVIRFETQTPMGIYRDMNCQCDFVRHLLLESSRGCTRQCLYLNLGNPRSNITPDSLYSSCLNQTLVRKTNPNDTNTVTKPKKHNVLLSNPKYYHCQCVHHHQSFIPPSSTPVSSSVFSRSSSANFIMATVSCVKIIFPDSE